MCTRHYSSVFYGELRGRNGLYLATSVKSPMFISNVGYYVSLDPLACFSIER